MRRSWPPSGPLCYGKHHPTAIHSPDCPAARRREFWDRVEHWTVLAVAFILLSALVGYISRP